MNFTSLLHTFSNTAKGYLKSDEVEILGVKALKKYSGSVNDLKISIMKDFAQKIHFGVPLKSMLLGGIAFNEKNSGVWQHFGKSQFTLFELQFIWKMDNYFLLVNSFTAISEKHEETKQKLLKKIEDTLLTIKNPEENFSENGNYNIKLSISKKVWKKSVGKILSLIQENKLKKVVLSRTIEISPEGGEINLAKILKNLQLDYSDCCIFYYEPEPGIAFIGATPELLVQKKGDKIKTMSLAGSMARGSNEELDNLNIEKLLNCKKERFEHDIVTQKIKDAINPLLSTINVAKAPEVMTLSYIHHLETKISGVQIPGTDIFHFVKALHPTPALGGEPKDVALRLISELEEHSRGWYGAPFGWVDTELNGEFVVAIRSALCTEKQAWLYAGAGIVDGSEADKEWEETKKKFHPLLKAVTK